MQGKATIMGHPIHPILVSFPIGFFVGAVVSDIISAFVKTPFWPSMSVVLIGFGIVSALLAALFGFVDYFTAPMSAPAKRTATAHMVLNLIAVVIFAAAFAVRYPAATSVLGYVLTVAGAIAVGVSGALGGHLAYHYRIGVEENAPASDLRSTRASSTSAWPSPGR